VSLHWKLPATNNKQGVSRQTLHSDVLRVRMKRSRVSLCCTPCSHGRSLSLFRSACPDALFASSASSTCCHEESSRREEIDADQPHTSPETRG
jgi:hypothetical protein